MDRAIVDHQDDRLGRPARLWTEFPVDPFQESDEVGAAFGGGCFDDQVPGYRVLNPEHRHLPGLASGFDPQIRALFGPGVSKIGMGQGFGFILEQQDDISRSRLLLQELEPQPGPLDRVGVLAAFEAVSGASPPEAPFFLSIF